MACPYLDYRDSDGDLVFDHDRPYCTLAGEFVAPVTADVCANRFDFHESTHCERYRRHREIADEATAAYAETD